MTWVERRWEGDPGAVGWRRARQSFTYRAFLPDPIAAIRPVVSFETAEAAARIIGVLPAQPIASADTIRGAIGAHHQRALEGLKVLADAGVLRQISAGMYDRQYAADELFELIEDYEAEVADRTRRPELPAGTSSS